MGGELEARKAFCAELRAQFLESPRALTASFAPGQRATAEFAQIRPFDSG